MFVVLHHPPVLVGVEWIDAIGLRDADALAEVVGRHPNVAGVLCGHTHSPAAARFAGVDVVMAPGVSTTLRMDWEDDAGPCMNAELPPGLAFHLYREGATITHFRVVV